MADTRQVLSSLFQAEERPTLSGILQDGWPSSLPRRAPGIVLEADRLLTPLYGLGVVGALLQVAGANWDVSSHILGIVDSFFTPSHLVLYLGILWLAVNFVVLWLVNAQGVAYTFGVCSPQVIAARSCAFVGAYEGAIYLPALFLDALGGAAVILLVMRTMGRRGLLTSVGALVVAVNATANLGFTAYMLLYVGVPGSFYFAAATRTAGADIASIIPPYLALLIPVLLLDLRARREGRSALVASLVAGPLSVFIDGRFSLFSGLWSPDVTTLLYLLPMMLGGLAARGINGRLEEALLAGRVPAALGGLPEQA